MRCPKCGYISFDHLKTCLNCSKDLSEMATFSLGTVYNKSAPLFLKFSRETQAQDEEDIETIPEELHSELDVIDPDLNILLTEEEAEEDGEIDFHPDDISFKEEPRGGKAAALGKGAGAAPAAGDDLDVDLSQFEDMAVEGGGAEERLTIDFPDELADISDLAPPAPPAKQQRAAPAGRGPEDEAGFDMLDLDLKLEGLDEKFSLLSEGNSDKEEDLGDLSLDDLDLSEAAKNEKQISRPKPAAAAKEVEMDMDADLDFDLDLGGLTIPPPKKK